MTIRIRLATESDRAFIRSLCTDVFSVYGDDYPQEIADNRFSRRDHTYFIAEDDSGPMGFALVASSSGNPRADLHAIAVDRSRQHQGVAQMLLAAAEAHARTNHSTELHLVVAEVNTAGRNMFQRAGFIDLGSAQVGFRKGQRAPLMRKPLPPIT